MNREIVYPGAVPLETDLLHAQQNTMIALGYLAQSVLGQSVVADGLACSPTATLAVTLGPGSITAFTSLEASTFSSLPADTADSLVKQGINISTLTSAALAAPVSAGLSINYLIEGQFLEADGVPVALPYYNVLNPAVSFTGPLNSGASQNTVRAQTVQFQIKAGTAATTGTQTTPGADSGWVPLWIVTVNYGNSVVSTSNIVQHPSAPFLPTKLPQMRNRLMANLNLYVSPTGNDSNPGTVSWAPFATLQKAWNTIVSNYDLNCYSVTVNCANGTYTAGVTASGPALGQTNSGSVPSVAFVGNASSPASVIISASASNCFSAQSGANISVSGFTLAATAGGALTGNGLLCGTGSSITILGAMVFGACAGNHIFSLDGLVTSSGVNYSITGGAATHVSANNGATINISSCTVTLSGTPAFSSAFASVTLPSSAQLTGITFSGSATGQRYSATLNGAIYTNNAGATYLPGSTSGTVSNGGVYY